MIGRAKLLRENAASHNRHAGSLPHSNSERSHSNARNRHVGCGRNRRNRFLRASQLGYPFFVLDLEATDNGRLDSFLLAGPGRPRH